MVNSGLIPQRAIVCQNIQPIKRKKTKKRIDIFVFNYICSLKYLLVATILYTMENLCKIKDVFKKIHQFEQKLNNDINVTINEAMVLCSLFETIKCSGDIAADTGISTSRTSRVLLALEQKGYVTRSFNGTDKRKMMFELSAEGLEKKLEISSIDFNIDFKI